MRIVNRFSEDLFLRVSFGGVAQLGERLLCKQEVIGSIPFTSTIGLVVVVASGFSRASLGRTTVFTVFRYSLQRAGMR